MRRALLLIVPAVILFSTALMAAPASINVEISERAYRDIEKLVSFGLCRPPMIDQRPLARSEFARIIGEARRNFAASEEAPQSDEAYSVYSKRFAKRHAIRRILDRLTAEFKEELIDRGDLDGPRPLMRGHALDEPRFDAILMSEAPLRIIADNGVGLVSAVVNPFLHYREGRHPTDGFQEAIESIHRFRISRHLAFVAHPRLEANVFRAESGQDDIRIYLQEGYAVLQAGDAAFEFGRSSVVWGPGEYGALLLTNNARPLDLIKFWTPSPFRLPWFLRHLGQWRVTLFGANLGPEQPRKYAWLTGYRLSYMPVKYLELGFGNTTMMGGEGTPHLSGLDIFGEFWGFRVAGTSPTSENKTNHLMEASLLVRVPQLWGLQVYGVINNDDKRDTLKRFFRDGSSYMGGFYLARLGNKGSHAFRFEFTRMGPLHYRHGLYPNGYTLNDLFIGSDLGSDALGIHTRYDLDVSDAFSLAAIFDWEMRRGDIHTTTIEPDGTLGDVVLVTKGPHEKRYRFVLEPHLKLKKRVGLNVMAGYERVLNAGYREGISRNNWLAAMSLKIDLAPKFYFEVE